MICFQIDDVTIQRFWLYEARERLSTASECIISGNNEAGFINNRTEKSYGMIQQNYNFFI